MFLADFHIHSTFSDGKLAIPELVDIYGSRGFGAIAITDHLCEDNTILGRASAYLGCSLTRATFPLYVEILRSEAQRAWDQYGMVVIPGVELTKNSLNDHRSSHIVALGIEQYLPADGDVVSLVDKIHNVGGIAIAAHPVWTRKIEKQSYHLWAHREELRSVFDAWEVASGPYLFPEVAEEKLPMIASSDLHQRRQLTSWKSVLQCERYAPAILRAITRQQIDFRFYNEEKADVAIESSGLSRLANRVRGYDLGNAQRA